ncbi:methionine ABC transporter permease [Peptostreptococcus russellii]|uniref:D-methionine transport system permease protein n=1 Tax=Peptostreptococcus russellii TaxID=215200 RepID=A0A1H8IH64_9FIRM|nr:methionine ABC transporter permease [Peptostreptococcus russellii]SEN67566.1 D-methionine transport system permease protein [Peptostreptococcus russellii]
MSFSDFMTNLFPAAMIQTLYMIVVPTIIATAIGFVIAVILVVTKDGGLKPNKNINRILGLIVNILRSFPFIILIVAMIPITRAIVGTSIGETAAIVPITVGSAPFIARLIENALDEVDKGLIEAAKSFGATNSQIIFKVMLKEATPAIVTGVTLSIISILGYTAMAGAVGAGGLGNVALMYGYQQFDKNVMAYTVIALVIIVQIIQSLGDFLYRKLK